MFDFTKKIKKCGITPETLKNKSFFITGASGLIGGLSAEKLLELSDENNLNIKLILLVRDEKKLNPRITKYIDAGKVRLISGDITNKIECDEKTDYIIHAASITDSTAMIERPIDVICTNFIGTKNILDLAEEKKAGSIVYLSSMEVYGFTEEEHLLTEDKIQYLDPLAVRSSYPESKRMAENLCAAYHSEYMLPVKIIRLAQTFGKGVRLTDNRVFAQFAKCARDKKDIVLATDGSSKRMYLDVEDAVSAILTVLLKGENGTAYNAANKATYCSIAEMAQTVAENIADGEIKVCFQANGEKSQFSPPHKFFLDTSRIESLGWSAEKSLKEMYIEMMSEWQKGGK